MGKVKRLSLHNARSWDRADLQLDPGLNVIVGPSDSGKSNLHRVIKAIVGNASGGDFVRASQEEGAATLEFDDGLAVTLHKGIGKKRVNGYTLARSGAKSVVFNEVGVGIPKDAEDALRLSPIDLSGEEVDLHFSTQRGPAFGADDTPSRVAKIVGAVSGLDVVYRAVAKAEGERRDAESNLKAAKAQCEQAKNELAEVDRTSIHEAVRPLVEESEVAIKHAEGFELYTRNLSEDLDDLVGTISEVSTAKSLCASIQPAADNLPDLETLEASVAEMEKLQRDLWSLEMAAADFQAAKNEVGLQEHYLKTAEANLATYLRENPNCPLCGAAVETHE